MHVEIFDPFLEVLGWHWRGLGRDVRFVLKKDYSNGKYKDVIREKQIL